jgi:hypothetical protein
MKYDPEDKEKFYRFIRHQWYGFLALDVFFLLLNGGLLAFELTFPLPWKLIVIIGVWGTIISGRTLLRDWDHLQDIRNHN